MDAKPTELGNVHTLPNCLARETRGLIQSAGLAMKPVFCANCHAIAPFVVDEGMAFAFYLCEAEQNDCASKWQHVVGTIAVPDEVFFERVKQAQLEHDGRELSATEQAEALKSSDHYLSKLAKDRALFAR